MCVQLNLATVLNGFYGQSVTEKQVLDALGATDRSTFEDLRQVTEAQRADQEARYDLVADTEQRRAIEQMVRDLRAAAKVE